MRDSSLLVAILRRMDREAMDRGRRLTSPSSPLLRLSGPLLRPFPPIFHMGRCAAPVGPGDALCGAVARDFVAVQGISCPLCPSHLAGAERPLEGEMNMSQVALLLPGASRREIATLSRIAREEGCELVTGGQPPNWGWFVTPDIGEGFVSRYSRDVKAAVTAAGLSRLLRHP